MKHILLLPLNYYKGVYMCLKMMKIYAGCNLEVQRYCEPSSQPWLYQFSVIFIIQNTLNSSAY